MAITISAEFIKELTWEEAFVRIPEGQDIKGMVGTCSTDEGDSLESFPVITLDNEDHLAFRCDHLTRILALLFDDDEYPVILRREAKTIFLEYDPELIVQPFLKKSQHTF